MKVKEESEKVGLKLNIQKTKIMASGSITLWEIDGETVSDFIFLGSKITADGDCSHEIKRCLLLGRKAMTNLDSILKSRHISLPTKVHIVKAMVFPVTVNGCEMVLCRFSHISLFVTLWTVAHQAPLSMGILQARILGWVDMRSSRGSSQPRDQTRVSDVSCIGRWVLYH